MHLESVKAQTINVLGHRFDFAAGETIHTESSHKFTVPSFTSLAENAGWKVADVFSDATSITSRSTYCGKIYATGTVPDAAPICYASA